MKVVPPRLKPNSTIALISPSARLNHLLPHRLTATATFLSTLGYRTQEIYTPIPAGTSLSASARHRAAELHAAFADPAVAAIVCTIGGSSCNELLPYLDFALIRAHPKVFCGFSDITVLHYALYVQAGLRTFYGPTAITQWGEVPEPSGFTTEWFLRAVVERGPLGELGCSREWTDEPVDWFEKEDLRRERRMKVNPGWRWLRKGYARGVVFGGCLPTLMRMAGTRYDLPSYEGVVLLVELPEGEARKAVPVERMKSFMCDLRNRGVFDQIVGLVVGRTYGYDEGMMAEWERYIVEITEEAGFPVLCGVDVGHTDPILTVPLGALTELDGEKGVWAILESGVVD